VKFVARHDGNELQVEVERFGAGYRVRIGDRVIVADLVDAGPSVRSLRLEDGTQFSLLHHREGNDHQLTLASSSLHVELVDPLALKRKGRADSAGAGGILRAPMPGRIVRLLANAGETVRKGQGILILEAMKMENEIQAPADGVVSSVSVTAGQTVESGAELVHLDPA
jgi:biotin carboxyl carrier protein